MSNRRKRKFAIRFELGLGGLLGLATICLCIFLWLFLLGVWAGQTVLLPSTTKDSGQRLQDLAGDLWQRGRQMAARGQGGQQVPPEEPAVTSAPLQKGAQATGEEEDSEPAFFTLQVATHEGIDQAREEMLAWTAKGYDAFYLEPEEGSPLYRVFVGRFASLGEANSMVESVKEKENIQAFITLLSTSNLGR
ncbi:MAG: SPOR domain-containing protein [Thermodesulfobacteriota bacterium]